MSETLNGEATRKPTFYNHPSRTSLPNINNELIFIEHISENITIIISARLNHWVEMKIKYFMSSNKLFVNQTVI